MRIRFKINFSITFFTGLSVILFFALIFKFHPESFSVNEPKRAPYFSENLASFFSGFCLKDRSRFITNLAVSEDGCIFQVSKDFFTGSNKSGYYIKSLNIGYYSYSENNLKLRYHIKYEWVNVFNKLDDENGVLEFDLSLLKKDAKEMQYTLNPYVAFDKHLIQKVEEREFSKDLKSEIFNFPSTLSLLSLEPFSFKATGRSITSNKKFPTFIVDDLGDVFYKLKKYMDNGVLHSLSFTRALSFSAANFLSFGFLEVYPNSNFSRVLCSLELFLGIIWYGLVSALFYDFLTHKHEVTKKRSKPNKRQT